MKPFTNPLPKPPRTNNNNRPFDPWNSSSTGHQRREASRRETDGVSETGWRASRTLKVNSQFKTQGHLPPPQQPQQQHRKSVAEMLARPGSMKEGMQSCSSSSAGKEEPAAAPPPEAGAETDDAARGAKKQIFAGLVVYVNGSTAPLVSDHRLKALLAAHGARVALHLARRQVTHVILGRPAAATRAAAAASGAGAGAGSESESRSRSGAGSGSGSGSGGGLAGTKMDREIRRRGGNGIKYIGVEWILESIRVGKRLPEARFANVQLAPRGQSSVYDLSRKPA
ncbi:hypothetical protein V2A60_004295 [Cordyceps javanica]